jgi:hypothetical protein
VGVGPDGRGIVSALDRNDKKRREILLETAESGCGAERCPLCRQANDCRHCTAESHKGPCWCAQAKIPDELLARVPLEMRNRACICSDCVAAFSRGRVHVRPEVAQAGDFYFDEAGLVVFKAEYHLRRGYCCGSGCRHCPYPTAR